MADTQTTRVFVPVLSLIALAGALFSVIVVTESRPSGNVELVLNMSQSARPDGAIPVAPRRP